ncbi:MAG: protein kinase, partial [Bacteroidota bacterium]
MIRKLIKKGQTQTANEKLAEFIHSIKEIENECLQLINRNSSLKQKEQKGVIGQADQETTANQLTLATLYYCQELEKKILEYFPSLNYTMATVSLEEQLGLKLMGKYHKIQKVIDGSSMAFFRAHQTNTDRRVMLRISKKQSYDNSIDAEEEKAKLRKVFGIKHRNIIKVLNADLENYPRFLVLEHINGVSLDHLVNRTPFSQQRALAVFKQLAEAVYYLHINQIVHKNIKPDKVLIDNELVPVISPFDIVSSNQQQKQAFTLEQLLYTAPEILKNEIVEGNYQSDQFSLGLLMYEMLAGRPLFGSEEEELNINAHVIIQNRLRFFEVEKHKKRLLNQLKAPRSLKLIIAKMLSERPAERYPSMREVILDLEKIKIPTDPQVDLALASYERCCISNPDFVEQFYGNLFNQSEYKVPIKQHFADHEAPLVNNKRFKMLRVAIDLIIHCQKEPENLKHILNLGIHQNVEAKWYKSFIKTII